jgi:hypothetical protein
VEWTGEPCTGIIEPFKAHFAAKLGRELHTGRAGIETNETRFVLPIEGEPVSFILRRFVAGVALIVGLMVYASLRKFPWAIDLAICVGYTVEVVGLVVTARLLATQPAKPLRPIRQLLLIHASFLAGVVGIERTFPLLQILLPGGPTQHGRQGSWALLIEILVITILGYGERRFLLHAMNSTSSATWADTALAPLLSPGAPAASGPSAPTVNGIPAPAPASSGLGSSVASGFAQFAVKPVASAPVAVSLYQASTGEDYEEFLQLMQAGKRQFRKPGLSIRGEYELWLAHRAKIRAAAPVSIPSA